MGVGGLDDGSEADSVGRIRIVEMGRSPCLDHLMEVGAWLEIMAVLARWADGWGTIGTVETDASSNSRSGSKGRYDEEIELAHSDHRPAIVSASTDSVLSPFHWQAGVEGPTSSFVGTYYDLSGSQVDMMRSQESAALRGTATPERVRLFLDHHGCGW
eukprot:CAMPEP_0194346436 /NCGR_PEP_ID=MMETSP0171-20130528/105426_1 /TAXON_ID=218684 /ORGANISM="Corethron pennatum, Strain L29A3" /LENGTH=157 /DNA_ID=CAMNT_0039113563 /DNA_START=238 /DNA_END=709 /DNA_ORIENTATION=+